MRFLANAYERLRRLKYKLLSDGKKTGEPICVQPVLISGEGSVQFGKGVYLGTKQSPFFYTGYIYINTRHKDATIVFEDGVWTNNNLTLISAQAGIHIKNDTIIGSNVEIYDCDFHSTDPGQRKVDYKESKRVLIGSNVWIGSNVTIFFMTFKSSLETVWHNQYRTGFQPSEYFRTTSPKILVGIQRAYKRKCRVIFQYITWIKWTQCKNIGNFASFCFHTQ